MSFILDALKKSETDRQQQGSAEFSSVPTSSGSASPARWLWMLAALLAINFAVLIGILMRPDATPDATPDAAIVQPEVTPAQEAAPSFEDQVADAIEDRPEPLPVRESVSVANPAAAVTPAPRHTAIAVVPTIDQLRLDGSLQIAELHLDIHVFSEVPAERFVFINMVKHREGSRIDEGPVVREIRADGVVLEHQGRVFLLPRE